MIDKATKTYVKDNMQAGNLKEKFVFLRVIDEN